MPRMEVILSPCRNRAISRMGVPPPTVALNLRETWLNWASSLRLGRERASGPLFEVTTCLWAMNDSLM